MNWRNIIIPFICLCSAGCVNKDFDPDKWDVEQWVFLSKKSVSFSSSSGADTIEVHTNYKQYSAYVEYENYAKDNWCSLSVNAADSILVVNVEPNVSTKQRVAIVCVEIGRNTKTEVRMPVIQTGGAWDVIAGYTMFLSHEISQTQREILEEIFQSFITVKGGSFDMGAGGSFGPEKSDYHVTLDDFVINKYEITQKQWQGIMGTNPSEYSGENHPVDNLSWQDAFEFCQTLSALTNIVFKLPTEAQWEYAAKGGKQSYGYIYSGGDDLNRIAHHIGGGIKPGHPLYHTVDIGTKLPNELGLYDMSGNVSEYCQDVYEEEYPSGIYVNPTGPSTGEFHVVRGGHFADSELDLETTWRNMKYDKSSDHSNIGFRIVLCK